MDDFVHVVGKRSQQRIAVRFAFVFDRDRYVVGDVYQIVTARRRHRVRTQASAVYRDRIYVIMFGKHGSKDYQHVGTVIYVGVFARSVGRFAEYRDRAEIDGVVVVHRKVRAGIDCRQRQFVGIYSIPDVDVYVTLSAQVVPCRKGQ